VRVIDELPSNYSLGARFGLTGCGELWRGQRKHEELAVTVELLPIGATSFAAVGIAHPNLARVLECGVTASGRPFLALPRLDGDSLAERIRTMGPLSGPQVAYVGSQVAFALTALHAAGLSHHCLTTASLYLVGDQVQVFDAGLVTARGAYAAPEGSAHGDPRVDIYALGCVAYELACGHAPIAGSAPTVADLGAGFPATLAKLIARMVDPDPNHRPREAHELARVLALLAGGESAPALGTTIGAHFGATQLTKTVASGFDFDDLGPTMSQRVKPDES